LLLIVIIIVEFLRDLFDHKLIFFLCFIKQ